MGWAGEDGNGVLGDLMGHDPSVGGEREDWGGNGVAGADLCIGHSGCVYISLIMLVTGYKLTGVADEEGRGWGARGVARLPVSAQNQPMIGVMNVESQKYEGSKD